MKTFRMLGVLVVAGILFQPMVSYGDPPVNSGSARTRSCCTCAEIDCSMTANTNYLACLGEVTSETARASCRHDWHTAQALCPQNRSAPSSSPPSNTPPAR